MARVSLIAVMRWLLGPAALLLGLAGWQLLAQLTIVPSYMLPTPGDVGREWLRLWHNGVLRRDLAATLREALLGFALAFVVGVTLGYLLARSEVIGQILAPYVALSQAMPVLAFAPLLVVWFGVGVLPKVLICALIVFFPILVNTETGLRGVDRSLLEASWTMGATTWQTLRYVEVPLALGTLLSGVRMGMTLAMTGAMVGEFVAASEGLGYLMTLGRSSYNAPMVFAASLTMVAITVVGYVAISLLERRVTRWQ